MAAPVTCADVLVIGGGPAGTSAAITSAKRGLSVVMIEARTFPRQRPGETLHPGVEPLLETLGVAEAVRNAGFPRHAGIWVKQGERLEFQQYGADRQGPWLGFQANRAQLDALLLAKVKAVGVTVLQPERALGLLYKGNNVSGATTTAGAIEASTTIDASGSTGWLARQLALSVRRISKTRIAMYGYMEGSCPVREDAPLFFTTA